MTRAEAQASAKAVLLQQIRGTRGQQATVSELLRDTPLSRYRIESALSEMVREGLVLRRWSRADARKRVYSPVSDEQPDTKEGQ